MAAHARRRRPGVLTAHVTLRTLDRRVFAGQGKFRLVVIEIRRLPGRRRMALRAILRKSTRHVIRIRRLLIIR